MKIKVENRNLSILLTRPIVLTWQQTQNQLTKG